ncbi:hypothetical protein [Paenibacillus sp. OAS669]|uniref:hypothetical protein n=1 Tax=Paenibacillus sp. OAS669 TaxID=2663821 RepID=UPI00178B3A5D|nr:hypothetical protein [Paenibacillus sp. OAS669]MBE1440627.1 hypothetical protein [Paenibacillus sp. OAS669]
MENNREPMAGEGNWVDFHDLMETLNRKKLHSFGGGGGSTTIFTINGTDYKLPQSQKGDDPVLIDITPLIEAKLMTLDEARKRGLANPQFAVA